MQLLAGRLNFQAQARVLPRCEVTLWHLQHDAEPQWRPLPCPQGTGTRQPLWDCSPQGQGGWGEHPAWWGSGCLKGQLGQGAALACLVRCNPCAVPCCTPPSCLQQQPACFPELLLLEWALESPDFAELLKVISEDTARNVFQCMPAKANSEVFG